MMCVKSGARGLPLLPRVSVGPRLRGNCKSRSWAPTLEIGHELVERAAQPLLAQGDGDEASRRVDDREAPGDRDCAAVGKARGDPVTAADPWAREAAPERRFRLPKLLAEATQIFSIFDDLSVVDLH
jgi:hypothetical protein